MLALVDSESSASAKLEWLDCCFDFCLPVPVNVEVRTIGVGRWKNYSESLRKELANLAMLAGLLRDVLIPLGSGECPTVSAASVCKCRVLPQGQLRNARGRGACDSGHLSTCSYRGDAVVHFSSRERTDSYRASSTCTRGGSRQTRMYRS
jgi:hypothetical protein